MSYYDRIGKYQMGRGIRYVDFVKEWHDANPQYSWKEAMELAAPAYHQMMGTPLGTGYSTRTKIGPSYGGVKRKSRKRRITKRQIDEFLGGASDAQKGLLASLLQGLDANISIK